MTDIASPGSADFQRKLYLDLDQKLRASAWNSGVSEAHGLLTALACRGITASEVGNKMYLFQVSESKETTLLQGLFELILRDLNSEEFAFNLLLPDEQSGILNKTLKRADELANWCEGFLQGFCHDSENIINSCSESVQEIINDLFEIGGMDLQHTEGESEEDEKSLVEIEEYLRVGIQLIFDELAQPTDTNSSVLNTIATSSITPSTEIH